MKRHVAVLEPVISVHQCVARGDISTIRRLAENAGIDFASKDADGRSPLRLACEMMGERRPDGISMVQALLSLNLPHFLVNRHADGLTVAFFAYMNGSQEALSLIQTYGLQPSIAHVHPLRVMDFYTESLAVTYSEQVGKSTWVSQLLSFQDTNGQNVFHHLSQRGFVGGVRFVLQSCREERLDYCPALNAIDNSLSRPIEYAAELGNLEVLKILKEAGASVHIGGHAYDPLRITIWFGHTDAFRYLLEPTLETGVSIAELRDSATQFWELQRGEAMALAPGLETVFPEDPRAFNNLKTVIAINRSDLCDKYKASLREYRNQLHGIQKILVFLSTQIS